MLRMLCCAGCRTRMVTAVKVRRRGPGVLMLPRGEGDPMLIPRAPGAAAITRLRRAAGRVARMKMQAKGEVL